MPEMSSLASGERVSLVKIRVSRILEYRDELWWLWTVSEEHSLDLFFL